MILVDSWSDSVSLWEGTILQKHCRNVSQLHPRKVAKSLSLDPLETGQQADP